MDFNIHKTKTRKIQIFGEVWVLRSNLSVCGCVDIKMAKWPHEDPVNNIFASYFNAFSLFWNYILSPRPIPSFKKVLSYNPIPLPFSVFSLTCFHFVKGMFYWNKMYMLKNAQTVSSQIHKINGISTQFEKQNIISVPRNPSCPMFQLQTFLLRVMGNHYVDL